MQNYNTSAPWEVIAGPAEIYIAAAGTARPTIATYPLPAPSSPTWVGLGTNKELNYDEQGIRIASPQEITKWKSLGDTGSRKAFRVSEDFQFGVKVVDITLEQWAHALNGNTITPTAQAGAAAGSRKIGLSRGPGVVSFALLIRYPSPYGADLWGQIWVPYAINEGQTELMFQKGTPAGLDFLFSAMINPAAASDDERFGVIEDQDDAPGS